MAGLGQQQSLPNPSGDDPYYFQHAASLAAAADVASTDPAIGHIASTVPQPAMPSVQCNTLSGDGDNSGNSAASTEGAPEDAAAMGVRAHGGGKRGRCVGSVAKSGAVWHGRMGRDSYLASAIMTHLYMDAMCQGR